MGQAVTKFGVNAFLSTGYVADLEVGTLSSH
jgi:hypothetical protein